MLRYTIYGPVFLHKTKQLCIWTSRTATERGLSAPPLVCLALSGPVAAYFLKAGFAFVRDVGQVDIICHAGVSIGHGRDWTARHNCAKYEHFRDALKLAVSYHSANHHINVDKGGFDIIVNIHVSLY